MEIPQRTILLVEDNEDDVFAMQWAMKQAKIANPLQIVVHGQEAIDYLSGSGLYANRDQYPLPFLIFLDLKMPFVNGFEVLSWIRQQPALNTIPVVVLTSSDENKDHQRAYALGARSYLVKPPDPEALRELFKSMQSLWSVGGFAPS